MRLATLPAPAVYAPPAPVWTVTRDDTGLPVVVSWFGRVRPTPIVSLNTGQPDPERCAARAQALADLLNRLYANREVS
jgi:hypothetical protein